MATLIGNIGIVMKGNWSSSATYDPLNAVSYNNGLYIAKQAVPANTAPTNTTYWQPGAIIPEAPNRAGDLVDVTPYNNSSNRYVFPSDGYLTAASERVTSGSIQIPIRGNNGSTIASIYMNITANYQMQSLFVRKGMQCWVQNISEGASAYFIPLIS